MPEDDPTTDPVSRGGTSTGALHSRSESSPVEPGEGQMGNVGSMYISFSEHRRLIKLLVDAAYRAPGAARATFLAGNVMRVAVTGADADNQHTPVLDPPPLVRIWTSGKYASWLEVPMISATAVEGDSRHD